MSIQTIIQVREPVVKLLNAETVSTFLAEAGSFASICYDSSSDPEKIALQCLRSGHFSGMRIVPLQFYIGDVSRAFSHQFVRHHVGIEINQRSQRYVIEDIPKYILPDSLVDDVLFAAHMQEVWRLYGRMIKKGIPAEDARMILPNACATEFNVSMSIQALINLCHERLCTRAQKEFRSVVVKMVDAVEAIEPRLSPLFVPKCMYRNGCPELNCCGRVSNRITFE